MLSAVGLWKVYIRYGVCGAENEASFEAVAGAGFVDHSLKRYQTLAAKGISGSMWTYKEYRARSFCKP